MSDTKLDEAKNIATPPERLIELVGMSTELARAVATNPNAPPKLLEKLSRFNDLETRRNVALNPNTATNILFKLGKDFPEEFLNNPVLTLLLLENPNFLEKIPTDTFIELLLVPNVTNVFVDWALQAPASSYNYTDWRLAIASNPNTTKEILLQLYKQFPKTNIAQAALLHVNWNGEITSDWHEAAFIEIRTCGYISRDKFKEQLLQELGIIPKHLRPYSEDIRYIISLYKHSFKTYKYLDLFNHIPFISQIACQIFYNLKTICQTNSSALLFVLPYLLIKNVIKTVFKNKIKTSVALFILTLLIIIFPSASLTLFKLLSTITYSALLVFLSLLASGLFGLTISYIIITTILIKRKLFRYISKKINIYTKNYQQKQLEQKILSKYNSDIYKQDLIAARNPNTSPIILLELASSCWLYVREAVAANPNADASVLNKLLEDEPYKLKVLVAKHLNTPVELLTKFAKHYGAEVKIAVAQNIKTPLSILKYLALASKKYEPSCSEAIKAIKQRYPEELINILISYVEKTPFPSAARLFLLLHETAPSDFLTRHYRSLDWRERYAVAQNPNTPINILEKLRIDANCIVRATAKARF